MQEHKAVPTLESERSQERLRSPIRASVLEELLAALEHHLEPEPHVSFPSHLAYPRYLDSTTFDAGPSSCSTLAFPFRGRDCLSPLLLPTTTTPNERRRLYVQPLTSRTILTGCSQSVQSNQEINHPELPAYQPLQMLNPQ